MGPKRSLAAVSGNWDSVEARATRKKHHATTHVHEECTPKSASSYLPETRELISSASHELPHLPLPPRIEDDRNDSPEGMHDPAECAYGEPGSITADEVIAAMDMKENSALGCAFYSLSTCTLSVGQDIELADADAMEQMLLHIQPTVIIISSRAPESLRLLIEQTLELAGRYGEQPEVVVCVMDALEFSPVSSREKLLDLYSGMNMDNQATFLSGDPVDIATSSIASPELVLQAETQDIKLLRLGTVIDLASVTSVTCAGALISEIQQRRSAAGQQHNDSSLRYSIQALESFKASSYMFVSAETLAALQIVQLEMHPNAQVWSRDAAGGNATKESLSVYGLFYHIASTSQGRLCLRRLFLRPTMDIEIIQQRQTTISVLLHEQNAEAVRQMTQCLRNTPNARRFLTQLQKGTDSASIGTSFKKGVWTACESFTANTARLYDIVRALYGLETSPILTRFLQKLDHPSICSLRGMINKVIDFEQSKLRQRTSVRAGIDKKLDELKRQYDGMESFLTEVVNHISSASPAWASKHIRSCIFLPQLGFLTVVDTDEPGNSKYEGEGGTGGAWEKIFVSDCAACYKNDQMRELDSRYGDMYCEIGDREVEIIHDLACAALELYEVLTIASDSCGELDAILALAIGAQRYHWTAPRMVESRVIDIKEARHPLQELVVPCFVPNDCIIPTGATEETMGNPCGVMVLTGPNHSGKSVYLKQIGIIVYLAHVGSFVPATSAIIGTTDKILTRMSTTESVSENESAFAIDLRQTLQAIRLLTSKSLVLIDEFGKGTCSVNGAGLMAGLLDHLMSLGSDSRPTSLIATHFHEIFDGNYVTGSDKIQFARMDVRVDLEARGPDDQVTYLFQVSPGRSVSSFGTQCAARNGMPKSIVERAEAISLLISRNEDLAAFCARLSEEEEARLEAAEAIARRFVGHDMHGWEASSVNSAKNMIADLLSVRPTSLCLPEQGE